MLLHRHVIAHSSVAMNCDGVLAQLQKFKWVHAQGTKVVGCCYTYQQATVIPAATHCRKQLQLHFA